MDSAGRTFDPLRKPWPLALLFLALGVVYLFGLQVDVMEVDAAQYASISWEMLHTGSFLEVTHRGSDYLDKPPLLFWLSSLSFWLFGVSTVAFKLPSLLFALLGIYATYRFARLHYNASTAKVAALVVASSQALFLMTNDVRTDTMLMGAVIFSVWQLSAYLKKGKWHHFVLGFSGIGWAMLAKGPIGLVIPVLAFSTEFIAKKQWRNFLRWEWLLGTIIVAAWLFPMALGLYRQYGDEGLRFYFWTQSFGRITGDSTWENEAGILFFIPHIAWALLPWTLFLIAALVHRPRAFFLKRKEYVALGGFVLTFIALSLSKFKLPHYIFVVMPFVSVLVADYLMSLRDKKGIRPLSIIQLVIWALLWVGAVLLAAWVFPATGLVFWLVVVLALTATVLLYVRLRNRILKILVPTVVTAVGINFVLGAHAYPRLLEYQTTSQAGHYVADHNVPVWPLVSVGCWGKAFDFYTRSFPPIIPVASVVNLAQEGTVWVYANEAGYNELQSTDLELETIWAKPEFSVTRLSLQFLNPKTRHQATSTRYLVKVES